MNKESFKECRACLRETDKRYRQELFRTWLEPWAVPGAILADDLAKLADIEISEDDYHSKFICLDCCSKLADACSFVITVQNSDRILKERIKSTASTGTLTEPDNSSWPKPILLNKSLNSDVENRVEVEIKQEVLSEDEHGSNDMDLDWEPTMDIKIEPEEIVAPVQSDAQLNGYSSKNESQQVTCQENSNISTEEEYLDNLVKQEPLSGDEQDAVPDLPLDCMLCLKRFNSVTGLKAHVIADHSYGAVKRKSEECPSPVKETLNGFVCATCRECFTTRTDLMVHEASHGKHLCFVCDAKFNSFRQLSRHGARCRPRNSLAANTRPPSRPQLVPHTNSTNEEDSEPVRKQPRRDSIISKEIKDKTTENQSKSEPSNEIKLEPEKRQSNSTNEEDSEPVQKQPRRDSIISKEIKDKTTENKSKSEPSNEIKLEPEKRQSNRLSKNRTLSGSDKKQCLTPSSEETKVELVLKQSIDKPIDKKAKNEAVEKQSIDKPTNDEVVIEIPEKVITEATSDDTKVKSVEEQLNIEPLNEKTSRPIEQQSHSDPANKEIRNENVKSNEKEPHVESSDEETNVPTEKQSSIQSTNKAIKSENVEEFGGQSNNVLSNDKTISELVLEQPINEPSPEEQKVELVDEKPNSESSENGTKENVQSVNNIIIPPLETHISPQNSTDTFKISLENLDIDQEESSESESKITMAESIEEIVARLHCQDDTEQMTINVSSTNEQIHTQLNHVAIQDTESESSFEQKSELENSLSNEFDEKISNSTKDTVSNTDAVNEMKIHLAINPLSERDSALDTKMDVENSESVRNECCDQKLVNILSELSDDNVTQ